MDKKKKLYLGIGVVAVGAYLLLKSKKAAASAATAPVAPAKFVGANSFASVGRNMRPATGMINDVNTPRQKYSADGKFASVSARQIAADGGFASVERNMRPLSGGMINSTDVVGARAGSQNSGIFANQPFTSGAANMVGADGEACFANLFGSRKRKNKLKGSVEIGPLEGSFEPLGTRTGSIEIGELSGEFVNQSGKFFYPKTARYGQNEGVFAPSKPKRKSPVEPNLPVPVRQGAPLNNLVGADGGFFSVHDGFGK